ncbi:hypothetical protein DE4585_02034 [Mycobacteroides salmoniphilum]|uniref:Uncharacterized protein n=1 Tax=Mycobacteroides salmoniphilum TaxID=404941 RepID=A0A4R8S6S8_9MYCO|nr:hypothetical protein DE4585_02034 [Mycobacteroides salmoniphilum]
MRALNRNLGYLLVVSAVAVGGVGCGRDVEGAATKPSDAPVGVDTSLLNTGSYPTKAAAPFGPAGNDANGRKLEGARIAFVTVTPWEVDAGLAKVWNSPVILKPGSLGGVLGDRTGEEVWNVAFDAGFVAGFATDRKNSDPAAPNQWLQNAVLQFPDAQSAASTASAMTDKLLAGSAGHPRRRVAIPGHSDAIATQVDLSTFEKPGGSKESGISISSLTPHGPFILYQQAEAVSGDVAAGLASATLDQQIRMIDGFAPTEAAALSNLPQDPTGLLARTLPIPEGKSSNINSKLVWDARTFLNFLSDPPAEMSQLFKGTGLQFISTSQADLYQTGDAAGAGRLRDAQIKQLGVGPKAYKPSDRVPYLPDSACFEATFPTTQKFTCYSVFENYTFNTTAAQLIDAQQQLAAQYRILADK